MLGYFRRRVLSFAEIDAHCITLAAMARDFEPDHVVSILSGGWYMGARIAECLGCSHLQITVRRSGFPETVSDPKWRLLFKLVLERMRRSTVEPKVLVGLSDIGNASVRGKRILVVDDAIDTGRTLAVARRYFSDPERRPADLRTLVLGNMRGMGDVDYSLLRGTYCYPWSRISPEYRRFLEQIPSRK